MNTKTALRQLKELSTYLTPLRLAAERWKQPWKTLITTVMSARTRDEMTIPIAQALYKKYSTCTALSKAKVKDVQKIIRPINYYKTKSKHVVACAKVLTKKYNCKPPVDFQKLIELPGVGRKTANVFLSEMGEDAIAVDTHVDQLSRTLGWTKHKKPEKIEEDLKNLFPRSKWKEVNPVLVRFGRSYSKKQKEEILRKIKR